MTLIDKDENAADKKAVKEIVKTVRKEITRQVKEMVSKQSAEGLEEEIWTEAETVFFASEFYEDEHHDFRIDMSQEEFQAFARHFAEWGAEHMKK